MADEIPELTVPKQDAGAAFRVEMFATNFLMGYWWAIALVIVLFLASIGGYFMYQDSVANSQKNTSALVQAVVDQAIEDLIDQDKIDEIQKTQGIQIRVTMSVDSMEMRFPPVIRIPLDAGLQEFGAEVDDRDARLVEAGDALKALAQANSGVAAQQAWILSAEMYELGHNPDAATEQLKLASASTVDGLRFAADSRLANADVIAGNVQAAEARLRPWIKEESGFFGQLAALNLGEAYGTVGNAPQARAVYTELQSTWPASPLGDEVEDRLKGLGGSGAGDTAPTDGAAPTDDAAPSEETAPTDGAAPSEETAPTEGTDQ